jgi:hypothetical protein
MIVHTTTQHIAPSGILRHVESRLIAALGAWIPQFEVVTVYAATPPTGPFALSKTYRADSLCTSTVSTDTFSDSSSSFMWSVTSLEGDWDFDTQRDFVVSKEE